MRLITKEIDSLVNSTVELPPAWLIPQTKSQNPNRNGETHNDKIQGNSKKWYDVISYRLYEITIPLKTSLYKIRLGK